jgi:subtilase family serine protease
VTVSFTIRNQGSGTANASTTNIRLNTSSSSVTTSDPLLVSISTPSIAAGGTVNVSQGVTIPSNRSPGQHYVWVILDVTSTAGQGAANEGNDRANTGFTVTGSEAQSDLVVENLVVNPTSGAAGISATVSFMIRNQGSATANASTTNIRLSSSSSNVTTNDPLLATVSTPSLAQGETQNVSRNVTVPSVSPGGYFVWVIADVNSTAGQSNEANDRVNSQFTVTSVTLQSDLVIQNLAVTPSSGAAGASVTVSFTIRNQGSGTANASTTNIRLSSSNSNVTDNDPLLTSISTPSIVAGGTFNVTNQSVTVPNVSAAEYFVWIIADVNSTANQSNEQNDKINTSFSVIQPSAGSDLAVCSSDNYACTSSVIRAYPTSNPNKLLEAGEDSTIEFVIKNVGTQASQSGIYSVDITVWDVPNFPQGLDSPEAQS